MVKTDRYVDPIRLLEIVDTYWILCMKECYKVTGIYSGWDGHSHDAYYRFIH